MFGMSTFFTSKLVNSKVYNDEVAKKLLKQLEN